MNILLLNNPGTNKLSCSTGFEFPALVFILFLTFPGCANMKDAMTTPSVVQGPSIEYAKKKQDWPTNFQNETVEQPSVPHSTPEEEVLQGDRLRQQGKPVMAMTHYERALKANPDLFEVRVKIGNLLLYHGKAQDAMSYFIQVLDKHTDNAPAHEGLGHAYFQLEQFDEAEHHLLHALELNPTLWKPHALLGIIYDLQGHHMEAITQHSLAIDNHAEMGELYNNLGVSLALTGNHAPASQAFQEALRKGASHDQVYNNLGLALTRLGHYQDALGVLHHEGHEAKGFNNLGVLMLKDGYPQQAIACFEQALEAQPTFYPKAYSNLQRARSILRHQIQQGTQTQGDPPSPCRLLS